jgi:hypothetical protein
VVTLAPGQMHGFQGFQHGQHGFDRFTLEAGDELVKRPGAGAVSNSRIAST